MERFFKDPHTLHCKRQGPFGLYIDEFAQQLSEQSYSRQYACRKLQLVAELSHWLQQRKSSVSDLTVAKMENFLRNRARPARVRSGDAAGLKAFFELLLRKGQVTASVNHVQKTGIDKLQEDFGLYLQQERVLAPTTVTNYSSFVKKFLAHRFKTGRVKLSDLSAADVIESVQHLALSLSRRRAKAMSSALRSFLRYVRYQDFIRADLAACVPCVADWSVAPIPKGLPTEHINRVLARCNRTNAIGRRDYAILLLLARLGLRAGEVVCLTLEDVDWEAGCLTVRGKGNRSTELPLPADVGKAIAAYLKGGRLRSIHRSVFLRARAPAAGLKNSGAVGLIVAKALARAGINCCRKGAHQFRHTLATEMLRRGGSLAEIGEVLRHRNPQTTSIYAKVDLASLRTLALPWPGGCR
jgi:site-specific recombinase XerD